jgi:hypothetical protein
MRSVPHPLLNPYAAYLRVYEPLAAFPERDRAGWADYARRSVGASARADRLVAEHRSALAGVISVPPRPVPADEAGDAFVLEFDGLLHVCPVQSRLRSWVALGQFRDGLPDSVLHAFVPPASLELADADHARWGKEVTGTQQAVLRILTATWTVPVPWFVPFAPTDRIAAEDPAAELAVVHRTRMSAARRRVARALRTLRQQLGSTAVELDVAAELEELGRWLEEFHARSWVELDYAGLARLLGPEVLAGDTSVADVAASVAALAAGDEEGAVLTYRTVVERWAAVAALEHAN